MMIVILILTTLCALFALRARRVLVAILWLALVSALSSLLLYLVGAWLIAVIELSVGTGLATVLMVFVITMIGDEHEHVPLKPLRLSLVLLSVVPICLLTLPFIPTTTPLSQDPLQTVLWQSRGLDILPQIALIFVGMIGVLALSSDDNRAVSISSDNDLENVTSEHVNRNESQRMIEQEA